MIFKHHHPISVSMVNHLLIGDLNQRKRYQNDLKINVSHVICETSFITIYLLFSNLNLYRQRISLFLSFVCLRAFLSRFFRLIVFFSFSLLFLSVVVIIDVVLYFFFSRTSASTHARTMSRLLVDFIRLTIICMCVYQHNCRLLSFLFLVPLFSGFVFLFYVCVT